MSNETDKFNHSKRLQKNENAVKKQVKIAKEHGVPVKDPHRLEKHHAMDCGNPGCPLCSNPRRSWNELTIQEKRKFQETEIARMRHSNGTMVDDNE
jgi:hypothetical protein